MGYLFLSFALLSGATKGYCGKKLGAFAANSTSAVLMNLIRMMLCILFGFVFILLSMDLPFMAFDPKILLICALSGVSLSINVVTWLISVRRSAYMMLDVFGTIGTAVPMIGCYLLFGEAIRLNQWIGFVILVVASFIMCSYNNSIKIKLTFGSLLLIVISGVANGFADLSQKLFVKTLPQIPVSIFNFYTYFFAALTLAIIYTAFLLVRKEKPVFEQNASWNKYVYVLIMALMLFVNSYSKTVAASYLDSAQLYPLNQGMSLVLSTLMAAVFFKEKLTLKGGIGILLSFAGLLIMNLL